MSPEKLSLIAESQHFIRQAAERDITLTRSNFEVIEGELYLDGMDPGERIEAMTMD